MGELGAEYASVLDQVRGIAWPARRSRSVLSGPHPSTARGGAAEFVEYRPYRQGDETGRIDWKLVARTDRVFTRVSLDRTTVPTLLVVDASASMDFPRGPGSKWAAARHLAIGLAALARDRGDPVGLLVVHPESTRYTSPRTRRTVLAEMIAAMDVTLAGTVDWAPALQGAVEGVARLVILSDFLEGLEAILQATRILPLTGGELFAVHLVAAEELEPDLSRSLLEDPEQAAVRRPMSRSARMEYQRRFEGWREEVAESWREIGAHYTMIVPGRESLRQDVRRIVGPGPAGATR